MTIDLNDLGTNHQDLRAHHPARIGRDLAVVRVRNLFKHNAKACSQSIDSARMV